MFYVLAVILFYDLAHNLLVLKNMDENLGERPLCLKQFSFL